MSDTPTKPWYKHWWGIIIAIVILPYFLIWYIWAKTSLQRSVKIIGSLAVAFLSLFYIGMYAGALSLTPGTPQPTADKVTPRSHNATVAEHRTVPKTTSKPKTTTTSAATTKPTATPTPKPQPAPAHTIVYQFSLMSGSMNANDEQNVGISWHDPTNGQNQLPSDILGAIQQINAGSYSVTYHISSVKLNNLYAGVNNYSNPDATIGCTILVDGNPISNETSPKSGYADCSGDGIDNQSGT